MNQPGAGIPVRTRLTRRKFLAGALGPFALVSFEGPSVSAQTTKREFTTSFVGIENPLSEGGAWSHRGWSWTKVQKKGGLAFGTQTGSGGYDDSYAYLSGFAPDHGGEAIVHVSPTLVGSPHEVEILLRWADSPMSARGYECTFSVGGDIQIVRWNGPFGDFTPIGGDSLGRSLVMGDALKATIVGATVTCFVNGRALARATDQTWKDGQPGIGFFRREAGTNGDLAFSRYSAVSL